MVLIIDELAISDRNRTAIRQSHLLFVNLWWFLSVFSAYSVPIALLCFGFYGGFLVGDRGFGKSAKQSGNE